MVKNGAKLDPKNHNYIRLERLHVNVDPRPGQSALEGTVESREYYGLYIKYYISVAGQTLKVIEKNDGVRIYEEGQAVEVILDPADVMAYEPKAEATA
jgi:iron(III) transport system ATP-binding protein